MVECDPIEIWSLSPRLKSGLSPVARCIDCGWKHRYARGDFTREQLQQMHDTHKDGHDGSLTRPP